MKKDWFFYHTLTGSIKIYTKKINCIKPERTKYWKQLNEQFNRGLFESIGYDESPDLPF